MQHHTCSTSFISDSILENRSFLWTISDFSLSDSIVNVDNFFWKNKVGFFKEVFLKLTIWNIDLEITKTIEKDLIKKYNFNRMLDDRFDINIAESEKKLFHIYKNKMLLL